MNYSNENQAERNSCLGMIFESLGMIFDNLMCNLITEVDFFFCIFMLFYPYIIEQSSPASRSIVGSIQWVSGLQIRQPIISVFLHFEKLLSLMLGQDIIPGLNSNSSKVCVCICVNWT